MMLLVMVSPRPSARRNEPRLVAELLPARGIPAAVVTQFEWPTALRTSCAGMRWSVPELGTNMGTNSLRRKLTEGQLVQRNGGQGRD